MTNYNPIAKLMNLPVCDRWTVIEAAGVRWEYKSASPRNYECESMYRRGTGHGVSNPCFSLFMTPEPMQAVVLGQRLACRRGGGVKKDAALAILASADAKVIGPVWNFKAA